MRSEGGRERGEVGQRADSASIKADAEGGREGGREVVWTDGTGGEDERRAGVVDVDAAFVVVGWEGEGRDDVLLVKETHGGELPVAVSTQDKNDVGMEGVTVKEGSFLVLLCVLPWMPLCAAQSPPSGACSGAETAARGEARDKRSETCQGKHGQ